MTIVQQLGRMRREDELNLRALEFVHLAKWLAIGGNRIGNALHAAEAAKASPRITEAIKAAMSAGTTTSGSWAAPLAYQELAEAFLESLRTFGVFDAALPFTVPAPLNSTMLVV